MEKHHIAHLEKKINELHASMTRLTGEQPVLDLLQIIHKPGWTTIAEQELFMGVVEAMHAHTNSLAALKQVLLSGASKVALNPQPLPPSA